MRSISRVRPIVVRTSWLVFALAMTIQAQITTFDAPVVVPLPNALGYSTIADMDGDGDADILTTNHDQLILTVNPGDIVLGAPLQFSTPLVDPALLEPEVADLDGDGRPEVIIGASDVFDTGVAFRVYSLAPNGDVTVTAVPPASPSANPNSYRFSSVAVCDRDGDGDLDVIVDTFLDLTPGLWMFENLGGGLFDATPTLIIATAPQSYRGFLTPIRAEDFDGDGVVDFSFRPDNVTLGILNGATGNVTTFRPPGNPYDDERDLFADMAFGDFDGDGDTDFAPIVNGPLGRTVAFVENMGGTLRSDAPVDIDWLTNPNTIFRNGVAAGDFDDDGTLDVVASAPSAATSGHYYGVFIGSLTPATSSTCDSPFHHDVDTFCFDDDFGHLPSAFHLAAGDLDGDGDIDLVHTGYDSRLRILLNRQAATANFREIEIVSGGGQSAVSGTAYPQPFVVRLRDPDGTPIAGEDIDIVSPTGAQPSASVLTTGADGTAIFNATAGPHAIVDRFRLFAYRAHPNGTMIEATVLPSTGIEIVGGETQQTTVGTPFGTPLAVRVFDLATGDDLIGYPVEFRSELPGSFSPNAIVATDASGIATVEFTSASGPVGNSGVIALAQAAPPAIFDLLVDDIGNQYFDIVIHVVSGGDQLTPPGTPFDDPLVIRAATPEGVPYFGAEVRFWLDGDVIDVLTDLDGRAQTTFVAPTMIGRYDVSVSVRVGPGFPTFRNVVMNVALRRFELESGAGQVGSSDLAYRLPFVVRLTETETDVPVAGETVTLTDETGATFAAVTDDTGRAMVHAVASPSFGNVDVELSAPDALPVEASVFHRHLTGFFTATSERVTLIFRNDRAGVPIAIAADAPQPAPGFSSTVFGEVFTSLLAPSAAFVIQDGIGLFGPPLPGLVANPLIGRVYPVPGVAGSGAVAVFQVYGFDATQPYPLSGFVSNPVTLTF